MRTSAEIAAEIEKLGQMVGDWPFWCWQALRGLPGWEDDGCSAARDEARAYALDWEAGLEAVPPSECE
jgi:hypothetical protein